MAKKNRPEEQKKLRNRMFVRAIRAKQEEKKHQKKLLEKQRKFEERMAARLRVTMLREAPNAIAAPVLTGSVPPPAKVPSSASRPLSRAR